VRPLALDSLRRTVPAMTLDLGADATPHRPPRLDDFVPPEPGVLTRTLGRSRHERALAEARSKFDEARHQHAITEAAREARFTAAQQRHNAQIAELAREVADFNERLDRMADGLAVRDRHAVSDYFELAIHSIADPDGFPAARRAGYIPESGLLVLEWDLPQFDIIPEHKAFSYVQRSDTIKSTPLAVAIRRTTYRQLIAAIALPGQPSRHPMQWRRLFLPRRSMPTL
jgi:restriction system protein